MRGRSKPTALEIAEGNPSHRPINGDEPAFSKRAPIMPKRVAADPVARSEWKRLAPIMVRAGVLTEADGMGLELICKLRARLARCEAKLGEALLIAEDEPRLTRVHPVLTIQQQTEKDLGFLMREYGFTPASRSKIHVGDGVAADRNQESLEAKLRKPKQLMTVA